MEEKNQFILKAPQLFLGADSVDDRSGGNTFRGSSARLQELATIRQQLLLEAPNLKQQQPKGELK
jgi:hypothetical protein